VKTANDTCQTRLFPAILHPMKNRIGLIVLVLACIGLGIVLISTRNNAERQQSAAADRIVNYSNQWVRTSAELEEQRQVAAMLEKDLEKQKTEAGELTNSIARVSSSLAKTEASLKASQDELARRDAQIAKLESDNRELDERAVNLNTAITNLTVQIDDTKRRLAASEGDKAFLEEELKRLMGEKAELERQFNDLTVLRAQVAELKKELSISRRLEWLRQGLFASTDQKGAQKLIQFSSPVAKPQPANYDLNVEVSADGSVKIIPPTNAAPAIPTANR
jgi:septal ring factor EnvC (AmiA/AmiB activator)